MTPALKAMVEAMAAEIVAQECRLVLQPDGVTLDSGYDGAQFDLEKVARAGLEAIKALEGDALVDIILAGAEMDDSVSIWFPRLIDAILTPTTGEGNG